MRIAIVGSVGVPASYGGFETLVENLIEDSLIEYTVYCSGKHFSERHTTYKGAKLIYLPISANGVMSICYDVLSLMHGIFAGHRNFLVLGTSGAFIFPLIRLLFPSVTIITNIDGLEWQRSKWSRFAKSFLRFSETLAVKYSHSVIADNDEIAQHIHSEHGRDCKTIAYGGDHALLENGGATGSLKAELDYRYFLAISRIEPENNVHEILQAFTGCEEQLIFIGNWQTTNYGKKLFKNYHSTDNFLLLEAIYDVQQLYHYRKNCFCYIHGHSAGGTNPSLVEIMHFAKPIIAFDCKYNRSSMNNKGFYFSDVKDLHLRLSEIRCPQDNDMRNIAMEKYTWKTIRKHYSDLFQN